MSYISIFAFFLLMSCDSQTTSKSVEVQFEDIYHHFFNLTSENFLVLDSQEKVDKVYEKIGNHYGGNRKPPIPQVSSEEKYIIYKPILKSSNDVEIMKVEVVNDALNIQTKAAYNPEVPENNRTAPNILLKISTKRNIKKVITQTQN